MKTPFWKTSQGQSAGFLSHEVGNSTSMLGFYLREIEKRSTDPELKEYATKALVKVKIIDDALDLHYTTLKKEHDEPTHS